VFAGDSGTEEDPHQIADWHHVDDVRYYPYAHFILTNDIDATTAGYAELAGPTANGGKGWQPIGTGTYPFTGIFDGRGYEISDMFINRPDHLGVGFLSEVGEGGVIKDTGVVNATVTGDGRVGGLVGENRGTVSNY